MGRSKATNRIKDGLKHRPSRWYMRYATTDDGNVVGVVCFGHGVFCVTAVTLLEMISLAVNAGADQRCIYLLPPLILEAVGGFSFS